MPAVLQAIVSLNKNAYERGLSGISRLTHNATGAMAYAFGGVAGEIMTMTRAFGPLGAAMTVMKESITIGADFEQSMANVASVTGITGDALADLGRIAREVAYDMPFTANEATKALYSLGSAGLNTSQALRAALVPSMKLAAATQSETALATETMTATLAAFRLNSDKATYVANRFIGTIATSPATMNRLSEAMSQAAPVAAAFNVSLTDTVTAIASFHKVGIMGSQAGTAFRQALIYLNRAATEGTSAIGKALAGWVPATEGLQGAIERLSAAGITGQEVMNELGIRGGKAVAAAMALGADGMRKLREEIQRTGDVERVFAIQTETVTAKWKVFLGQLKDVGLSLFMELQPALMGLLKRIQENMPKIVDIGKILIFFFTRELPLGFKAASLNIARHMLDWAAVMAGIAQKVVQSWLVMLAEIVHKTGRAMYTVARFMGKEELAAGIKDSVKAIVEELRKPSDALKDMETNLRTTADNMTAAWGKAFMELDEARREFDSKMVAAQKERETRRLRAKEPGGPAGYAPFFAPPPPEAQPSPAVPAQVPSTVVATAAATTTKIIRHLGVDPRRFPGGIPRDAMVGRRDIGPGAFYELPGAERWKEGLAGLEKMGALPKLDQIAGDTPRIANALDELVKMKGVLWA